MEIINRIYGNIEGFEERPPAFWQRVNDDFQASTPTNLKDKKGNISEKTEDLKDDIKKLSEALNAEKIQLQKELEKYTTYKKDPETNNDKAAEPLKDETLKFSNYSYIPLAYYPIGCLFLLFLIYKKL